MHALFGVDYGILLRICSRNLSQQFVDGFMDYLHALISLQIMVLPVNTGLALKFPLNRDCFESTSKKFTIDEIKF
jgi:hypothetical protein